MTVAPTLERYLASKNINYDVITHAPTMSSSRTAEACRIRDSLKFTSFVPHPDIAYSEITGKQDLVFFINIPDSGNISFEVGNKAIDPQHFDPKQFNPLPYEPHRSKVKTRRGQRVDASIRIRQPYPRQSFPDRLYP